MYRNKFGDPRPASHAELVEALDELDASAADLTVIITDGTDTEDAPYNGWNAEISGVDNEGEMVDFGTVGYASQEALRNDLKAAGFTDITVE